MKYLEEKKKGITQLLTTGGRMTESARHFFFRATVVPGDPLKKLTRQVAQNATLIAT
jgi:hypothetical protein